MFEWVRFFVLSCLDFNGEKLTYRDVDNGTVAGVDGFGVVIVEEMSQMTEYDFCAYVFGFNF